MNTIPENDFIQKVRIGFFEKGLSRGSYGMEVWLKGYSTAEAKVFEIVKQLVEEPKPKAGMKIRIYIPENFKAKDLLSWFLDVLSRYGFMTQLVFPPDFASTEILSMANWKILQVTEPKETFNNFDELWFMATDLTIEKPFPLWPLPHAMFLYVKGLGLNQDAVVRFICNANESWSMLQ